MLAVMSLKESTHIKASGSLENVSSFSSNLLLVRYCISYMVPVYIDYVPTFPLLLLFLANSQESTSSQNSYFSMPPIFFAGDSLLEIAW